jgi:hypothetical protein
MVLYSFVWFYAGFIEAVISAVHYGLSIPVVSTCQLRRVLANTRHFMFKFRVSIYNTHIHEKREKPVLSFICSGMIVSERILRGWHSVQLLTISGHIRVSAMLNSHLRSAVFAEHQEWRESCTSIRASPSDGTLNGAPCQGSQPPWHAKDRFPDVRKRVGSLGAIRETHTFKTKHYILIYCRNMAEILLKRRKTPNQSIKTYIILDTCCRIPYTHSI